MDGVALASIVTSGVVALGTGVLTYLGPVASVREERRQARLDRRANAYLEMLHLVELEARSQEAVTLKWEIAANYGAGSQPPAIPLPDIAAQAKTLAGVAAFASPEVRQSYNWWRQAADAVTLEQERQTVGWDLNSEPPETAALRGHLHPTERTLRDQLATAVAADLDGRVVASKRGKL